MSTESDDGGDGALSGAVDIPADRGPPEVPGGPFYVFTRSALSLVYGSPYSVRSPVQTRWRDHMDHTEARDRADARDLHIAMDAIVTALDALEQAACAWTGPGMRAR